MSELTPLRRKIQTKPFLVLDIESKADDTQKAGFTRPFMVGVDDGERYVPIFNQNSPDLPWYERYYRAGGCVDLAMRYICQQKYRGYHVYAHNGGRFDFLFILPWLMDEGEKRGFGFNIVPVASSIQILDLTRGKNTWRFLDSYKLIPTGLDKAAKSFGLPGKLEHDLHLHESDARWIEYNQQDCRELFKVIERFHHYVEKVLCGEVGVTAPSTAVKLYRRKYLKAPLPRSLDTHEFVRASYFGGRVEVFEREGKGLSYFDINSSYPAAMLKRMPGGEATWWEGEPPKRFLMNQLGFCEVSVTVPDSLHIPPLPIRGDKENGLPQGKLVFPTGRVKGIWEWEELQLALEVGCTIEEWHKSVWYKPVDMFGEYVTDLYQYRDKNNPKYDEGLAAVVKIMLNATYGKFGMKTIRKKIYRWDDPEMPENATPASPNPDCPIWYAEEETDAPYIMPQIAARVTALGRVSLYRYMMQAQALGGRIYYCDTDSIITDVREGIETSTALGGLKDEYPEQSGRLEGRFIGPKLYLLTDDASLFQRIAAKGLQLKRSGKTEDERREAERYNRKLFEEFASGKTVIMHRLEKVGTLAREGFSRGPRMKKIPRTNLETILGKREHHEDGSTSPYRVEMW